MAKDHGGTDLANHIYGVRDICSAVAILLGDPSMEKYTPRMYEHWINLAQMIVSKDTKALVSLNESISVESDTRSIHIVDDWAIKDFLGIKKLWIDGYPIFPTSFSVEEFDFVNDLTTAPNDVRYLIKNLTIFFEPMFDDDYNGKLLYYRKPRVCYLLSESSVANSNIELGDEYVDAIKTQMLIQGIMPGSDEFMRLKAAYNDQIADLVLFEHTRDEN